MARSRTLALKVETEIKGLDKLDNLGKKLSDIGKKATTFVTLPLLAAGAAAVNFASDLEEATNKATTVFGDAAADMIKESENLNDAFSQAEFLDLSGTFGSLLKNMEFTTQEAKDMSAAWLDLAADMASFHNVDPTEAIQAIQSALTGEFTPLKRFGVALSVATIEAKALEMGLWDGTGAIDANTRALVIQSELIRQQPDLIGDWDRTLGGAANQQRLLTKNFQDAAAAIGQELLPIATQLITTVNDWIKAFKELSPETRGLIVQIAGIAAATGPLLFVFGRVLSSVRLFAGAGRLVFTAWRNIPTALGYVDLAIAKLRGGFTALARVVLRSAPLMGAAFHAMLGPLGLITGAIALTGVAISQNWLGLGDDFEKLKGQVSGAFNEMGSLFDNFALDLGPLGDRVHRLADETGNSFEAMKLHIITESRETGDAVEDVVRRIEHSVLGLVPITEEAAAAWNNLGQPIAESMDAGVLALEEGVDEMVEIVGRAPGDLANELRAGIDDYDEALQELTDVAVNSVSDLAERQKIEGILASQELTDALNSDSTRTRLLAADLVTDLVSDYELLAPGALGAGRLVNPALSAGLMSNLGLTTTAAGAIRDAAGDPLVTLGDQSFDWGARLSANFLAGMSSYHGAIVQASIRLGAAAASGLRLRSPAEKGPLAEPADIWGRMLGLNFAEGLRDSIRAVGAASIAVAGAAVLSGSITDIPRATAVLGGTDSAATVVNNFYLRWDGEPPKGRNEEEIIGNLQRLSPLVGNALVGGS